MSPESDGQSHRNQKNPKYFAKEAILKLWDKNHSDGVKNYGKGRWDQRRMDRKYWNGKNLFHIKEGMERK